jgi:hypothetical protein
LFCLPDWLGDADSNPGWAVLKYPENLTMRNMLYYLAVPTLTYQVCVLLGLVWDPGWVCAYWST